LRNTILHVCQLSLLRTTSSTVVQLATIRVTVSNACDAAIEQVHDEHEELKLCTCLDYYLDNVMEQIPELALCMRSKGYIQGCRQEYIWHDHFVYLPSYTYACS
jgi:hypothetical protein